MKIAISGKIIDIPSGGPSGPDGNPIGTVISYMGTTAPKDYLICDGATYNISDYYKLAQFFKTQFGAENYFGGDGTTTFAVPDMRNLFLRGFHGEATEQLSGDLGVKQDGTEFNNLVNARGNDGKGSLLGINNNPTVQGDNVTSKKVDKVISDGKTGILINAIQSPFDVSAWDQEIVKEYYTSRPVNMAVLYCIKATVAESYENVYSTEETRIGTWIDGKPLYRKVFKMTGLSLSGNARYVFASRKDLNIEMLTAGSFCGYYTNDKGNYINECSGTVRIFNDEISLLNAFTASTFSWDDIEAIIEYTKTTDTTVKEIS